MTVIKDGFKAGDANPKENNLNIDGKTRSLNLKTYMER